MEKKYVLAIDQSTQGTKAILFDTKGHLVCRQDLPHTQWINEKGWVSHDLTEIYQNTILKWFDDSVKGWERKKLFQAVWDGNEELLSAEMTKLLRKTISYHDYKEDFYHAFLLGIFAGAGYSVESNKEHGEGRSDVVVHDVEQGRVAVFEVKYAKTLNDMSSQCAKALKQIQDKMYAKDYEDEYEEIDCYGISFYKKRCKIRRL